MLYRRAVSLADGGQGKLLLTMKTSFVLAGQASYSQ